MKWVKCIYSDTDYDITVGKVYKVLRSYGEDNETIKIYNDLGKEGYWSMLVDDNIWFEDVTAEIRDNKINEILD